MGNDLDLKKAYGDDLMIRNSIADNIGEWKQLQELREAITVGEELALADWREKHKDMIARKNELEQLEQTWLESLNTYVEEMVVETGRKQFFDRLIVAQVRKRAGEYKVGELITWARERRFMELFTVPKKPGELLMKNLRDHDEHVFEQMELGEAHDPPFLEMDEKEAVKLAIDTTPSGARKFPKAPVPLETYVTRVSLDSLRKLLYQLLVEVDIEEKAEKKDGP